MEKTIKNKKENDMAWTKRKKKNLAWLCDSTFLSKYVCGKKSRTIRQRLHVSESGGGYVRQWWVTQEREEEQVFRVGVYWL